MILYLEHNRCTVYYVLSNDGQWSKGTLFRAWNDVTVLRGPEPQNPYVPKKQLIYSEIKLFSELLEKIGGKCRTPYCQALLILASVARDSS